MNFNPFNMNTKGASATGKPATAGANPFNAFATSTTAGGFNAFAPFGQQQQQPQQSQVFVKTDSTFASLPDNYKKEFADIEYVK